MSGVIKKTTRYDKKIRRHIVIREVETQVETPKTIWDAERAIRLSCSTLDDFSRSIEAKPFDSNRYEEETYVENYLQMLEQIEIEATTVEEYVMEIRNKIDGKMQLIEWKKQTGKEPKLL